MDGKKSNYCNYMTEKETLGILRHLKEGKKIPYREGICSSGSEVGLKGGCNKNGG